MANRWWQFRDYQPGLMTLIGKLPRYIACSRTTRRPIFEFVSSDIHPDTKLAVLAFEDDYSFGIIQSLIHWEWVLAGGFGRRLAASQITQANTGRDARPTRRRDGDATKNPRRLRGRPRLAQLAP